MGKRTIYKELSQMEYLNDEISLGLKDGSQEMFCYLYNRYFSSLNRFSFHIIAREESSDIVHDVFVKLWDNHKNLPLELNIKSYLYTSVKNRSLDYLRHLGVEDKLMKRVIEAMLYNEDSCLEEEDIMSEKLSHCIEKLPAQQLKVVRLKIEGKSYKEISEELNISTKTVNNHLIKIYDFVRKNLITVIFLYLYR